jgi:hypothetical protein
MNTSQPDSAQDLVPVIPSDLLLEAIQNAESIDACLAAYQTLRSLNFCASTEDNRSRNRRTALDELIARMETLLPRLDEHMGAELYSKNATKWMSWLYWLPCMLSGEATDQQPKLIVLRNRIAARAGYLSAGIEAWDS